jgi:citrate synthase
MNLAQSGQKCNVALESNIVLHCPCGVEAADANAKFAGGGGVTAAVLAAGLAALAGPLHP